MQLLRILYLVVGAFTAITAHEYIKALVSYKLGDPLPKARGRLTLNPLNHFEPIGFLCMVLTSYGWGRPVETAAVYYKDRKKGTILTYVTPSMVNLLLGIALSAACRYMLVPFLRVNETDASAYLTSNTLILYLHGLLYAIARANISLGLFNFIPVYPLDGAKILALIISPNLQIKMTSYEKIFQIILLIALFTGLVSMLLTPLQSVFLR